MNQKNATESFAVRPGLWYASLGLAAAALVTVLRRVPLALRGEDLFCDDAYYYIITARNFVETGRFTFDGWAETNGFHPLLFWLEAAGFAVLGTGADPLHQYQGVCCGIGVVFLMTIVGCLFAAHAKPKSESDAVLQYALVITMCVLLVPRFTKPYLNGMESVLVLPLIILVGGLAWKARYGLAGVVAVLLVMARLDTLPYVVAPIGLACVWRQRVNRRAAVRSCLYVVVPAVVGALIFMWWNGRRFGNPMPIHGVLKGCFPWIHFQPQQLWGGTAASPTLTLVLPATAAGTALLLTGSRSGRDARGMGLACAVLGLIQLAAFALFQKWSKPVPAWYLVPAMFAGTFALSLGLANVLGLRGLRRLATVAGVGVLAANVASVARAWHRDGVPWARFPRSAAAAPKGPAEVIEFMKKQPGELVWACTDCGKIAFWSGRRVVNLDGLVNDFQYQKAVRDQHLARYLIDRNVRYLVFLAWDRPPTGRGAGEPMYECRLTPGLFSGDYDAAEFYVVSYQYMTYSDKVRLPRSAEVWRSTAAPDGRALGRAVVFDLDVALRGRGRKPSGRFPVSEAGGPTEPRQAATAGFGARALWAEGYARCGHLGSHLAPRDEASSGGARGLLCLRPCRVGMAVSARQEEGSCIRRARLARIRCLY